MLWWKRLKPDDPAKREALKDSIRQEGGLEKHDMLAMILSALLVLVPVALVALVVLCLVAALPILLN